MKKNIVILSICLLAFAQVNAQIEQGTILVGGMLGFSSSSATFTSTAGGTSTTTDLPKYSSFNLGPWVGYMITEDFGAGIGINYSQSKTVAVDVFTTGDESTSTASMFTIAPGVRYYYVHGDMVHLYAQLGIPIGFGSMTDEYNDGSTTTTTESSISSFGVGLSPGATINLTERCGLDFSYGFLGFSSYTETADLKDFNDDPYTEEYKSSGFSLDWAGSFNFGILFNF